MAVRRSTPNEAREIAEKAAHWLRMIRDAKSVPDLNEAWHSWRLYADSAGVCPQIKEHFVGAYAEVASGLKDRRVTRDPTGERAA